jgi:hypothetical protein
MKYIRRNVLISVVAIQTHDITDPLSRSILCGKASNPSVSCISANLDYLHKSPLLNGPLLHLPVSKS